MTGWTAYAALAALGLGAGVLSGMFGIGGGLVIVPALVLAFGFDIKTAVGTSLFALLWPVGLLGVREYWARGEMRASGGAVIAIGLFIGALFGAKLTGVMSPGQMKRAYGVFLLTVGTYFLWTAGATPRPAGKAHEAAGPARGDQTQ